MACESAAASGDEVSAGTQLTVHSSLWHTSPLLLYQEPMRDIGFKLYPAALATLALIEAASKIEGDNTLLLPAGQQGVQADYRGKPHRLSLHLKGLCVLELGAGACGVGAIAAAAGGARRSVASDTETVLPVLSKNIQTARTLLEERSLPSLPTPPGDGLSTQSFLWGSSHAEYAAALGGFDPPQVVLGADIVYYEELIDPLLHALKWLCTPGQGVPHGGGAPLIVLTYVQRIRKAKAFTKRAAAAGFSIDVYQLPHVVDYDVLLHRALHPTARFAATPLNAAEPPPDVPTPAQRTAHFQSEDVWFSNAPEVPSATAAEATMDAPEAPPAPDNIPEGVKGGGLDGAQPKEAWEDFDAPLHLGVGGDSDSDAFSDDSTEFLARTRGGAAQAGSPPHSPQESSQPQTAPNDSAAAAPLKFCAPSKCFVYVLRFKGVPCAAPEALRATPCAT